MRKRIPKELKLFHLAAVIIASLIYLGVKVFVHGPAVPANGADLSSVRRVVDGDTLTLSNGEKVRLLGIDTPELHHSEKLVRDARRSGRDIATIQKLGKRAADFTASLVEGKEVRLEFDVRKRDKYGRLLAYVYLKDGTFVNERIVEEGYAQVMTIPPNVRYASHFLALQMKARKEGKGLWADGTARNSGDI
jgi:micrococcal nuclease